MELRAAGGIVMAVTFADHARERGSMGYTKTQTPVSSLSYRKGKIGPLQYPLREFSTGQLQ